MQFAGFLKAFCLPKANGSVHLFGVYSTGPDGVSRTDPSGEDPDDLNSWRRRTYRDYVGGIRRNALVLYAVLGALFGPLAYIGLVQCDHLVRSMVTRATGTQATEVRTGAFSLRTLLLFVAGCSLFVGLVVTRIRPEQQGQLLVLGGCVAVQWICASLVQPTRTPLSRADGMSRRERLRQQILQLTLLSGAIPTVTCLLWCIEAMCPGVLGEALEGPLVIAVSVFFPVAGVAVAYALIRLPFAFDVRILATQFATLCSIACPFLYSLRL